MKSTTFNPNYIEYIAREAIMLKKGVISDSGAPHKLTRIGLSPNSWIIGHVMI